VVVQTNAPDHHAIRCGARGDYATMARALAEHRRELGYPPFARHCRVVFEDADAEHGLGVAHRFAAELRRSFAGEGVILDGPSPAPLALVRKKYRHHLQLRSPLHDPRFDAALAWLVAESQRESRTAVKIDVDPVSMV
jgi:primosomal protein N' (replication factor Y)